MTRGQILCVPMILAGAALIYWAYQRTGAQSQADLAAQGYIDGALAAPGK